mmetsp:Transcript_22048/g.48385  ORF Transcript_22048/g.48385 Transcript_22048/m.48385 type:complete len:262 (-) Transcript_22048:219-1004(-)|eukprot:CAMPEP_0118924258 /NCGR_PEP_ID=MMETSP1169-20130426/2477_1 /TAXON_ID=36882 /ORGANISM="Pyramimonas obovata, Strain CCMP722" /LENGTH=261 /DNA_ID=CAMNT_0006865355 /DNA_START=253 /DNA_END=1038 /DNA_ORIENTATION=+
MSRVVKLLRLRQVPILHQLRLEEALLRVSKDNWLIVNDGTPEPAVVMGISGKIRELVNVEKALRDQIPVIKRYSGGGTVVVDSDTVFASLVFNSNSVPELPSSFPREIMSWTEGLYRPAFSPLGESSSASFALREHDYVMGQHKFGGNAQCITKARWVHHTSFLWDYQRANMEYLLHPPKAPDYREGRSHEHFLCKLKEHLQCRRTFLEGLGGCLREAGFLPEEAPLEEAEGLLEAKYLRSTKVVDLSEFLREEGQPQAAP